MFLRLSTPVFNVADAVVDAPPPVVEPADPPVIEPASTETAPPPQPPPSTPAWALKRISEEGAKRQQAEERAAAAERKAAEAQALAERLQTAKAANPDAPPPREPPPSPRQIDDATRQAEIRREAENLRFFEDTVDVRNKGIGQFGARFIETLNILEAVGATNNDFIGDVLAADKANAHVVLDAIAKDPEKAVALAAMSSRQRIAEIVRMTMAAPKATESALTPPPQPEPKPAAPAPKQVSKAPPPPPRIDPGAKQEKPWYEAESDEEWNKNFDRHQADRRARSGLR